MWYCNIKNSLKVIYYHDMISLILMLPTSAVSPYMGARLFPGVAWVGGGGGTALKKIKKCFSKIISIYCQYQGYIVRFPQCSVFLIPSPVIGIRTLWLVTYSRYLWLSNIKQFCLHLFHLTYLPKFRDD
jgi:hypothetical protein